MAWIEIDAEKCTHCGLCGADCPRGDLLFDEESVPRQDQAAWCIHCGHCAAICPTGALKLDGVDPETLADTDGAALPDFSSVAHLIRTRRSVRAFKPELSRATLEEIFDAINPAPTGANGRGARWTVIHSPEAVRKYGAAVIEWMRAGTESVAGTPYETVFKSLVARWDAGEDRIFWDAPAVAVVHAPVQGVAPTPLHDCLIAATYLELAAWTRGVGSCWAGYFAHCAAHHPPLREMLGLEEGEAVYAAMMLGHPKRRYRKIPLRPAGNIAWK